MIRPSASARIGLVKPKVLIEALICSIWLLGWVAGAEAPDLDLAQLLDRPIPLDWQEQRRHYLR